MGTIAVLLCATPALAGPISNKLGLRSSQSASAQPAEKPAEPAETESIDWSALNWDPSKLDLPARGNSLQTRPNANADIIWDRTDKKDGSTAVTAKKSLPTTWDSKVGVDMNLANQPAGLNAPIDPNTILPGAAANASTGAAWANVTAPALNLPVGWDKASIDARFDPSNEERKIGTTVSKSVPLNDRLSVTVQNGYSLTQTQTSALTTATATAVPSTLGTVPYGTAHYGASHYFSSDNSAKLNLLPTGTSLSVGTAMSTDNEKWLRWVGAEQKLFGGISVKGSVSETTTGIPDKSISAGFTRNW